MGEVSFPYLAFTSCVGATDATFEGKIRKLRMAWPPLGMYERVCNGKKDVDEVEDATATASVAMLKKCALIFLLRGGRTF